MNRIEIEHLYKSYGNVPILRDISLQIPEGSFVALVGPSGCGKSTLLRTIAGLEDVSGGTLRIDGEVVNDKPPRQRDVAMVFQSYALYPHMDVEDNMTYSLRLKRTPRDAVVSAVAGVARTLGLETLLDRMPRQLSGGQRQRVAMGRAIVRNPKVFLFDEPLSNLDAALRVHMRSEIRKLHRRLGATSVYVTHDQIEAMTMADHVVVLRAGRIEQCGSPLDLYERPANKFVGGFIGSPAMNFAAGVIGDDGQSARFGERLTHSLHLGRPQAPGRPVWIGLRPEHLRVDGLDDAEQWIEARVDSVETTGSMSYIEFDAGGTSLMLTQASRVAVSEEATARVGIDTRHIHVFDRETECAI
jgi:multiple sugar transport system ATP-binding protein